METQAERVEWLDLLGGLAMVMVFAQHAMVPIITRVILAFHMPLFFWVSGYVSSIKKSRTFSDFVKKRFRQLIIPWVFWVTVDYLVTAVVNLSQGMTNFGELLYRYAVDLFYASDLWFLPCMFVSDCVYHGIQELFVKKTHEELRQYIWYSGMACVFWMLSWIENLFVSIKIPIKLDVSLMAIGFLFAGGASRLIVQWLFSLNKLKSILTGGLLSIISLCCVILNGKTGNNFMMYSNTYGNYVYAILGAICLIFLSVLCIQLIQHPLLKRYLLYIRKNSLMLFPIHILIIRIVSMAMPEKINPLIGSIIYLAAIHIFMLPICGIINRYAPALAGKHKELSRNCR